MAAKHLKRASNVALAFGLTAFSVFQASSTLAGSLVLVGGSWAYPGIGGEEEPYGVSIYEKIVELSGGIGGAKIGIISTASDDPADSADLYLGDFAALYGDTVDVEYIPITRDDCASYKNDSSSSIIGQIGDRNSFIFTGGDQSFITDCFFNEDPVSQTRSDTALIKALRQRFDEGAVIAGTSAGTAVQPKDPMITSGDSYESLRDGLESFVGSPSSDTIPDYNPNAGYYNPLGGLGFFEYGLLDSHFSERGRQGRIIRLASDLGVDKAFGIDENTALIVTDANTSNVNFEVLGQNGVFISDVSGAKVGEKNGYWAISGVKATYLTEGDQYNPLTGAATFGGKTSLTGKEQLDEVPLEENIFSYYDYDPDVDDWTNPRGFTETAIDLVNSKATQASGTSFEDEPTFGVTLTKTTDTEGFFATDSQGKVRYSFKDLEIAIAPVPEPGTLLGLLSVVGLGVGAQLRRKRSP